MARNSSSDPIFTPELVRIIKIFGLASLLLVLALSFFNEKRANNSGKDRTFKVNDSNHLFFLNLRAIHYLRENRTDAKMVLYRHKDIPTGEKEKGLNLVIVQNSLKDEAYIYFEPINLDWPISLKAKTDTDSAEFQFENGNAMTFLSYVNALKPWIDQEAKFTLKTDSGWIKLWQGEGEMDAIKEVLEDYFKLLENK